MIEIYNILDVEKHLVNIDAVIFDLDDTLYSEKSYIRSGYEAIANQFTDVNNMADKLWKAFLDGKPAIDEVLNNEGLSNYKELALSIYRLHIPNIKLYDGVAEMIERLRQRMKVGIITDGRPEGQRAKLKALGLIVDEIIITDELGGIEYRKPNDMAFRLRKERMRVPFKKMVYIVDNPNKDFIAPKMLGMEWIYFNNPDGLYSR